MSEDLTEKEKLGVDIIKDLRRLNNILEEVNPKLDVRTFILISDISTKVKNLTLKF